MKKISVKNIVVFRSKLERNQKIFLNSLDKEKKESLDGGGNYWVRSLSALSAAVKERSVEPIKNKITDILDSFNPETIKTTKDMYKRNLDILHNYEDYDFVNLLPEKSKILNKDSKKAIIEIINIPVQINPSQIYYFEKGSDGYVGAVWFVAKLNSFKKPELGIFAEALHIYLSNVFGKKYQVSTEHCLIIDVLSKEEVNYKMIADGDVPSLLLTTLQNIKKVAGS